MNASQFGAALDAYQAGQYARYMKQVDEDYLFDCEMEREMERLGKMPMDEALAELGMDWETYIGSSIKEKLIDVISNRTNDDY